jgi:hypothetical protein
MGNYLHRLKKVHYPQSLNGSNQDCRLHTDRAEWLTIIDEYEEATFQVEIENEMVLVPSKPSHLIGIIGQPLEDCTSKTSKRHAIKSV